jgi:RNA polymerase sigma factor (sigma-70 family)
LEASALTHASQRGLLARRSPLLKLQGDDRLIAMARGGNPGAFETIVDRYQGRLLGFCRQMLKSTEDAEDVLQEVFVNAYRAMLADGREINLRPWLYRIARNRCLNHLRKPTADAQESMDMVPAVEASSTAEKVHNREEFRQLLTDVGKLPETQRSALLLREIDALSYEEIAEAMDTSVPSVKSLLVRARISLAEASQARQLTCGEVRLELAEASEGLRKVSGPVRRHVRDCEECTDFRSQVRSNDKVLAALFPVGPLLAFKSFIASKLGFGGGAAGAGGGASAAGAGAVGSVSGSVGAAIGGSGAAGGIGAIGGAIGTKAVAGVVTAAVLTAGAAVEVKQQYEPSSTNRPAAITRIAPRTPAKKASLAQAQVSPPPVHTQAAPQQAADPPLPPAEPPAVPTEPAATAPADTSSGDAAGQSNVTSGGEATAGAGVTAASPSAGAPASGATVIVTVGGPSASSPPPPAPSSSPPQPSSPPAEEPPPSAPPSEGSSAPGSGSEEPPPDSGTSAGP